MKFSSLLFILILTSCFVNEQGEKPQLTFVENSLLRDSVSIALPTFEHGFPFVAYDSITYVNIYVINDSVVQVNDSLFELEKLKIDNTFKYPRPIHNEKDINSLGSYIENMENDSLVFNIFIDTNCHYKILNKLFNSFIHNYWLVKNYISIIDKNNNYIPLLKMKVGGGCMPPRINEKNILDIMLNSDNQLLIEGEYDLTKNDIPKIVKEWYTNPEDSEWLPRMDLVTEKEARKFIKILNTNITNSTSFAEKKAIKKQLNKWNEKLKAQQIIGDYRTLNRASIIFFEADNRNTISQYIAILEKINQGLLELRNESCLEHFKLEYNQLNLKFDREKKIKNTIDMIYSVKIAPTYYRALPPPPPPPNIN